MTTAIDTNVSPSQIAFIRRHFPASELRESNGCGCRWWRRLWASRAQIYCTFTLIWSECVTLPDVPVTVMV